MGIMVRNIGKAVFTIVFVCALFLSKNCYGEQKKPFYILNPLTTGLFSEFYMVIGFLDFYEKNPNAGIAVEFGKEGLYYERKIGPNYWNYYFKPISFGHRKNSHVVHFSRQELSEFTCYARFQMPVKRAAELVKKYIRLKPSLQKEVDRFCKRKFKKDYIIGVHYRGTDKKIEAPRLSYKHVYKEIVYAIANIKQGKSVKKKNHKIKIFLATDEQPFIEYLEKRFPGKIITTNAIRSTDGTPIHLQRHSGQYKSGKGAVLDCVLLSRCHFLLRMDSNLSSASTLFSPSLPFKNLNMHY